MTALDDNTCIFSKAALSSRVNESYVYVVSWFISLLFPLISEAFTESFEWGVVFAWWKGTIPFALLFLVNNFVLIPTLLLPGRDNWYAFSIVVLLSLFAVYEMMTFDAAPPSVPPPPSTIQHIPRLFMPAPVFTNILLSILVVGINLTVALVFKSQRQKLVFEETERRRQEAELKYLKTQIDPHFFMNMLNNIHAMVEVDPVKAQEMILELSKLMRYVLYDGQNASTSLSAEVKFVKTYVSVMRQRYPGDKVIVNYSYPEKVPNSLNIPPLMFITFVENAFKHGISYRKRTVIDISIDYSDDMISFTCVNSKPSAISESQPAGGVGLENLKRRLDLLYGSGYTFECKETEQEYKVTLIIPCL